MLTERISNRLVIIVSQAVDKLKLWRLVLCCHAATVAGLLLCNCSVVPVAGRSASQVWSSRGHPAGCAQRDGRYVLVTSTGQAGQLGQRNTVLHGT